MMKVNNSIVPQMSEEQNEKIVEYRIGEDVVKLTPNMVRRYLVRGNGNVSDQEVIMFINMCKYQRLNPFLNEAYLIKYGNNDATIVTGKDAILKRAMRNKNYEGQQAGVVLFNEDSGEIEHRIGSLVMREERLVGGWAKVFVKGYQVPIEASVSLNEYIGLKNDGTPNQQWARKPATMIRKVALAQALREAFPEDLEGLYDPTEMGVEIEGSPIVPVEITDRPMAPVEMEEPDPQVSEQQEMPADGGLDF